jgi:hypothetical protein
MNGYSFHTTKIQPIYAYYDNNLCFQRNISSPLLYYYDQSLDCAYILGANSNDQPTPYCFANWTSPDGSLCPPYKPYNTNNSIYKGL